MRQVSVTELKDRLSQYLRLVKAGEDVEITERSIPIARITRRRAGESVAPVLEKLVREGLVVAARQPPDAEAMRLPPVPCDGDVVAALVAARGDR